MIPEPARSCEWAPMRKIEYLEIHNADSKPFFWTKSAGKLLESSRV
jgi:hypothetical protein